MSLQDLALDEELLQIRAALRMLTIADVRTYGVSRVWGALREHHNKLDSYDALRLAYLQGGQLMPFRQGCHARRNGVPATGNPAGGDRAASLAWAEGWATGGELWAS